MTLPADIYLPDPVGQVRLLIADVDFNREVFTDPDVLSFLAMEGGSVKRAAATALDTIGTSELLVGKVIRTQDLTTDAAKLSAELRARADRLRGQADDEDGGTTGGTFFDVIPGSDARAPELTERRWWA